MPVWMKVDDARRYAGGLSRKALYAAVASGKLRAARVGAGRNLLFCSDWLDEWLQSLADTDDAGGNRGTDRTGR